VLIDIPKDITAAETEYLPSNPIVKKVRHISKSALQKAADMINDSKKPLIYAGGGVIASGASQELFKCAEAINAPVALSSMGLGGYPGDHPSFTGMLGMHGAGASNFAATECDLFIAVGTRFSDRAAGNHSTFAQKARIIHIDIDPAEIGKNVRTDHYVIGDVKETLANLLPLLSTRTCGTRSDWMKLIAEKKAELPLRYDKDNVLRPQYIIERIGEIFPDDIIVTEVGQHQMFACQYIKYKQPRTFISSGGLGAMGYGLGAAIGAAIGRPDKRVINIAGDGCFRMNSIEIATAVDYNIPIIEVIINNHVLGMVRQWQSMFYGKRYSQTDISSNIDFKKLAEAYHAEAITVTTPGEVDKALRAAANMKKTVVINCEVGTDDNVFPMVPPGKGIDETLFK
ncbi:MAG: acetolactate synthase large subunit, partial [Clostridiales bacterium]|nr:acetolactate synthase large subunit [Clostridiales bacterium]